MDDTVFSEAVRILVDKGEDHRRAARIAAEACVTVELVIACALENRGAWPTQMGFADWLQDLNDGEPQPRRTVQKWWADCRYAFDLPERIGPDAVAWEVVKRYLDEIVDFGLSSGYVAGLPASIARAARRRHTPVSQDPAVAELLPAVAGG